MKAMLLAAGEGTRFRPHTQKLPKPAIPLLNIPLGFYNFDYLKAAGVNSLIVNTFHLPEKIKALYSAQDRFPVEFSDEVGYILGNGGGLGQAKSHFAGEENFFHLNADEVIISPNESLFEDLKKAHLKEKPLCTLLVTNHPEVGHKFGGVWVSAAGEVIGFGKNRPAEAVHGFHYVGVQILNQKVFDFIPDNVESNILYDAVMSGMQKGYKVKVHKIECDWFETGNLIDYLKTTEILLKNLADQNPRYKNFREFLKRMDPHSQLIKKDEALAWIHSKAELNRVQIKNFAVVGKNSRLNDCEIEASAIGEALEINGQNISHQLML